jgi:hypothetical protein
MTTQNNSGEYLRIRISVDSGEATLCESSKFRKMDALWRADVLKDIIGMAESLYEEAWKECFGPKGERPNEHKRYEHHELVIQE